MAEGQWSGRSVLKTSVRSCRAGGGAKQLIDRRGDRKRLRAEGVDGGNDDIGAPYGDTANLSLKSGSLPLAVRNAMAMGVVAANGDGYGELETDWMRRSFTVALPGFEGRPAPLYEYSGRTSTRILRSRV